MRSPRTASLAITFFLLSAAAAGAVPPAQTETPNTYRHLEGPLTEREQRLFADITGGAWSHHSLLVASLIASGVEDSARLQQYEAKMAALATELRNSFVGITDMRWKAQEVLGRLHQRLLTGGYRLDSTDLSLALERGQFNCVSATVLFNCLAQACDLPVRGLEAPSHAMSRLTLPGESFDIETTCARGFYRTGDPISRTDRVAKTLIAGPVGAMQVAIPQKSPAAREVTDVQLVAAIYYNRGVELLQNKRYSEALAANAKALRLDPVNAVARGNLLATLNNWAIAEAAGGRNAEAADLLRQGLTLEPQYATFHANYRHVYRQWIDTLCRDQRFGVALEILDRAMIPRAEESFFEEIRSAVYHRWIQSKQDSKSNARAG
jgi:tetratricopeptide (TPR) repeat protein